MGKSIVITSAMEQRENLVTPAVVVVPADVSVFCDAKGYCRLRSWPYTPIVGTHLRSSAGGPKVCSAKLSFTP